jgi:hypothetical protein
LISQRLSQAFQADDEGSIPFTTAGYDQFRVEGAGIVAPHLPQRTNVFDDALAAAKAVSDEWPRVKN